MPTATATQPSTPSAGTTIVRLRVASVGLDPLVARLRAAAALEATSLAPTRLPPAAILCVRSLADPRPGTVNLAAALPFATQRAGPLWQQALTTRLDDIASRAARPLRQPVPLSADAVVFADQSELLACLARD